MEANDRIAQENRNLFDKEKIVVINLMSSPGAGKTSLLEKTIDGIKEDVRIGVIEGDIQSSKMRNVLHEKASLLFRSIRGGHAIWTGI